MIPKILEYEDGRIKVTPQAYGIPEIKTIIDTYEDHESYLTYVYALSSPESPYINIPEEEKRESVIYDVSNTLGEFDFDSELLPPAIERMQSFYKSPNIALAEELAEELNRLRTWLRNTPYGDAENVKIRIGVMEKAEKVSSSYLKVREQADKELKVATKGDHEMGGYFD